MSLIAWQVFSHSRTFHSQCGICFHCSGGKITNLSVEENTEHLKERWLAVILDLCSSICAVMRIHQFLYGGKNELHVGPLKCLEVFNCMLTLFYSV